MKASNLPPPPIFCVLGKVVDLAYPARREFFFVGVEDPQSKFSDSVAILAPAPRSARVFAAVWYFPFALSWLSSGPASVVSAAIGNGIIGAVFRAIQSC